MRKIGILGGTFNPIHTGHLLLADYAMGMMDFDEIWFIPTGSSYQKGNVSCLSGKQRCEMVQLAIEDYLRFRCLDLEIHRPGRTYTYETMSFLKGEFPDVHFSFLIGADCLSSFPTWKNPQRILECCDLVVSTRGEYPTEELKDNCIKLAEEYHGNVIPMPFLPIPISSSMIREKLLNKEDVRAYLPPKVYQYIMENNLYSKEFSIDQIKEDLQSILKPSRYAHTLGVADVAVTLAQHYHESEDKALLAGLLHDIAKEYKSIESLVYCARNGLPVSEIEHRNPYLLHSKIGAQIAKVEYQIKDSDILSAIACHTTGRENMSLLEKIVFVADYIEPNRNDAPRLDFLRELAYEDLDQTIIYILEDTLSYLKENGAEIDSITKRTLAYYQQLKSNREEVS